MLRDQTQSDEASANSKILKVQDSIHQFENVDNDIQAYRLAGGDDRLAAAQKAIGNLNQRIASIDDEIKQLSNAISEAESNIANMKQLERNVVDNLRYREMQRDVTRMKNKIVELEKENAETEVDKYNEQAEKLRKAHNKWAAEVSPLKSVLMNSKRRWVGKLNKWIYNCRNITNNLRPSLKMLTRNIDDNILKSR